MQNIAKGSFICAAVAIYITVRTLHLLLNVR